ncbi:serine hydrolase domain-containing protein [Saccharicrinis aurantiacus]|uniref:serine hydrolase domain-containing protein n=1 Tax=Saccharicrinis aurantiacus TaxID=1849719 RepID=UPI0009FAFFCB|nr:serine hydrolase domain-containing protein [Saccharicrinis aurantiacus]
MKRINLKVLFTMITMLVLSINMNAQQPDPVQKALDGWSADETLDFIRNFKVTDLTTAKPAALWYHAHASQTNKTAIMLRRQPIMELTESKLPEIGKIEAETNLGTLSLNDYLVHPQSFAQGFVVLHKGEVAYESYPGMDDLDTHFWASVTKVLSSLAVDLLIEDGLIDQNETLGKYVPDFKGSAWENIKIIDALDMSTGLDALDNASQFANPKSVTSRMFRAELGEETKGKVEYMLDVMLDAKPVAESGKHYAYSSVATQSLVFLVEAVSGKSWSDFFDERVWSKMGVEGPLQMHLSPDGIAIVHGPASSNLRDLARIGMLYTPSWSKISTERIVSPDMLDRIMNSPRDKDFYLGGEAGSGERFMDRLGDKTVRTAARQWDAIFEDGDFFKSGLNSQGLYVSPDKDLVIAFFSTEPTHRIQKYLRQIATSGLFD